MNNVVNRPSRVFSALARFLSLSTLGTFVLAGIVALRHMLETPQALDSPLPGEGHLYHWNQGYLYYKVLGAPDAPPLVLLHSPGIAASAYEMRGMVDALARRFRVYAPDLPGFGLSDRPSLPYTAELYTQIVREFLEQVVKQPAVLLASRLACNYAVAVAARSPELCSGLVLISPLALHSRQKSNFVLSSVLEFGPVKSLLYPLLVAARGLVARRSGQDSGRGSYYYATTHRFGAEHAVMALLAGRLTQDVSHEMEQARQPALVVWGADALGKWQRGHFSQEQQEDALWPKQARIELLPEGGYAVHEEQPGRVADAVLEWSENNLPAAPGISIAGNPGISHQPVPTEDVMQSEGELLVVVSTPAPASQVEAYCNKCKTRRPVVNARQVTTKNGRLAVQGQCAVCSTQLFRMGQLPPGYPHTPV